MQNKAWIEEILRELDFVQWDRYYGWKGGIAVYGWMEREKDSYKDFVVVEFNQNKKEVVRYDTSSAKYSEKIAEILGFNHCECQRVEDKLSIENMVEINAD